MLGSFPRRCCCGHGGALLHSSTTTTVTAAVRNSILFPLSLDPLSPPLSQQRRFILQAPLSAQQEEEIARHRHHGILMHPDSISHLILPPGNVVRRTTRRGTLQNQYVDLEYGHFWMLKDLQRSQEKPILSNETLIPQRMAKPFPILTKCKSLTGDYVDLSVDYFTRKNRSGDAAAQCTLVAISFRDYGFRQLSTWIEPFRTSLANTSDRAEVIQINFSTGWFNKWLLRGFIQGLTIRNTPPEHRATTFLYFGDQERFRDTLRMHNLLSGYVFLLDGLGHVRFAGSGEAKSEEAERLIRLAKNLTPLLVEPSQPSKQQHATWPSSSFSSSPKRK